jgi:hypothetical protein
LVVLCTSQKLLVMHVPKLCCLDGVVSIKNVRDPMVTVVVSTLRYLHFISYTSTLTASNVVSLHRWRLDSCILPWVCSGVCLGVDSISCIVDDVDHSVDSSVGWRIGCSIVRRISGRDNRGVGSGIGRLHYFIFTSSLFSYRLKGTVAAMLLVRTFRSTSGVGACCRSTVSRASFFNLSGGDMDISLETSYRRSIFKVV